MDIAGQGDKQHLCFVLMLSCAIAPWEVPASHLHSFAAIRMERLVDTAGEGDERHLRFVLAPSHWQLSLVLMICWLPQDSAAGRHRR